MVQINLLPDVKREYLHAKQQKHTFVIASVLVSGVAIALLVLVFAYVQVVQPRHLSNLQNDIDTNVAKTKETPNVVEMVTVQGALEQLPGLQDKKTISSRVFDYITHFTPRNIAYTEITLDTTAGTLSLQGETTDLEQANVLANNLKSAELTYTQNDSNSTIKPFSKIVFKNLGKTEQTAGTTSNNLVNFQIDMAYDPLMFDEGVSKTKLTVKADSKDLLIPTAKPFSEKEQK